MDPDVTAVSEVMTPNPTSVSTDDSAMEALGIMVERHFRHLPVRLNIARITCQIITYNSIACLNRTYHVATL